MPYEGEIRADFGPLAPLAQTIRPIERGDVNGMECHMDTLDFGRIQTEVFDDNAILNVMDASDGGEKIHYLLSMRRYRKGMLYTVMDERPEFGILGDPIRAWNSRSRFYKAIAVHGKVISSEKHHSEGYPPVLVMKVRAAGMEVSAAIKFSMATHNMRNLNVQVISGLEPWVKISGYGDVTSLRVDGKKEFRIYINSIRNFRLAENRKTDFGRADPDEVAMRINECCAGLV